MFDDFETPERAPEKGLNLIPIVDMLTTIIFFLLLSTTFYHYTKHTLPPSKISIEAASSDPSKIPPLGLKVLASAGGEGAVNVKFLWQGKAAGSKQKTFIFRDGLSRKEVGALVSDMKHLSEEVQGQVGVADSIRLSCQRDIPYQFLVSLIDAIKEKFPNVVLVSWHEAEAGSP